MVEVPETDEGWYSLHDFRSIEWDDWRTAPDHERQRAIDSGIEYLDTHESLADVEDGEGATAIFSILGDKADFLIVHFRSSLDALSRAERQFEQTPLANFTSQATSYLSVTEVSGYVSDDYFKGEMEEVNAGLRNYIEGKLKPDIPADEYVCFYPMSKRRGDEHNWYTLPFDERAELMEEHGRTGKGYAGKIKQVIASSVGLDDYEWGVTLFAQDAIHLKDVVYEMRFDEATSKYGEFGSFYIGRRFPLEDLGAYFAGESVPTGDDSGHPHEHGESHGHGDGHEHGHGDGHGHGEGHEHGDDAEHAHGDHAHSEDSADEESIRGELADLDIYAGKPHGEDVYATVLYSEAARRRPVR